MYIAIEEAVFFFLNQWGVMQTGDSMVPCIENETIIETPAQNGGFITAAT